MKAKDKAWQLYSNYFDIVEKAAPGTTMLEQHFAAINSALFAVDEALSYAPDDIVNDFDGSGEFYSVKSYYMHVKNEILKLNNLKTKQNE
jgi:hypothetical protein